MSEKIDHYHKENRRRLNSWKLMRNVYRTEHEEQDGLLPVDKYIEKNETGNWRNTYGQY